jgi:2-oxoglutarate dehydrogenase E1 component
LFHALRRQLAWPFRKPLIIMTPKSLLRHPKCVSDISEVYKGKFREIIDDTNVVADDKVKKVLFCSGKVYYDLLSKKEADNRTDVAIVRVEQLYPLVDSTMVKLVKKYKNARYFWVQEEPANMGAWSYINSLATKTKLELISRAPAASPATGFAKVHEKEQKEIVEKAFE